MQGKLTKMNGFADRFYWARHRAGLGAPAIADRTGCAQALINNIERGEGAKGSKFNNAFAKLFQVDANWLRSGEGTAPEGFDAREARELRQGGSRRGAKVLKLADLSPRWAEQVGRGASDADRADALQKNIVADFLDYARLAGAERSTAFLEVLTGIANLVRAGVKETERNGDKRSS